jgi:methylated-DNA-[protein]-cysteine S-methyltransferase
MEVSLIKNIFYFQTAIGEIGIAENGRHITNVVFGSKTQDAGLCPQETELLKEAGIQLNEYIAGKRRIFSLPLAPEGTEFQITVWKALLEIPYGETRNYKQIAEYIRNAKAYRAVGNANNKNPIPIFIPCHRVIGANGALIGYNGGIEMKKCLINIEKIIE